MQSRPELVGYSAHDGGNRGGHDSDHRAYHDGSYSPDQAPRIVKIGVLDNPQCLRNVGKHRFGMECFRVSSERGFPLWRVGGGGGLNRVCLAVWAPGAFGGRKSHNSNPGGSILPAFSCFTRRVTHFDNLFTVPFIENKDHFVSERCGPFPFPFSPTKTHFVSF